MASREITVTTVHLGVEHTKTQLKTTRYFFGAVAAGVELMFY